MTEDAAAPSAPQTPRVPPPALFGLTLLVGLLLDRVVPWRPRKRGAGRLIGTALVAGGAAFAGTALRQQLDHGTNPIPHTPTAYLERTGAYRYSRNPMYVGMTSVTAGAGLVAGSYWPMLLVPGTAAVVDRLFITPEETYQNERFGGGYAAYRWRTPRWLGIVR